MPGVSIVTAARNQGAWIGAAIASVRAQTFTDWELVVVDDGSTDDTAAIVGRAAADGRIRLLAGERRERAAARNRGIAATTGDLVAFLDGDDLWRPEKLARQVAALDAAPAAALCYTIARYVDEQDRPLDVRRPPRAVDGSIFPALVRANVMILSSVVARRIALAAVGGFDETLPVFGCEDWDLWLRIARRFAVTAVPEELTRYRRHPANTGWTQVLASGLAVLAKHYADPATAGAARLSPAAARARLYWYHAGAVGRRAAVGLAWRAVRASPGSVASRPAAGALATLVLPRAARRLLP
jgi:glycosyltransferase involved in cell wall biosynthesis